MRTAWHFCCGKVVWSLQKPLFSRSFYRSKHGFPGDFSNNNINTFLLVLEQGEEQEATEMSSNSKTTKRVKRHETRTRSPQHKNTVKDQKTEAEGVFFGSFLLLISGDFSFYH